MLEEIYSLHNYVVSNIPQQFNRYLYKKINWNLNAICVTGARGVGKTTLLLQHYKERWNDVEKCLYISADNIDVAHYGLFNIAKEYFKYGGEALIIDEVHKYLPWGTELKNIIDTFKNKKLFISGSSAISLKKGKADLSRRMVYYNLEGLSFREYLILKYKKQFPVLKLEDIIDKHVHWANKISAEIPALKYFKQYLEKGYFPFFQEGENEYISRLKNIIEKVIYEDIAAIYGIRKTSIYIIKKFLWLIATSASFTVNIEKMSRELGISKEYVYNFIDYLENANLVGAIFSGDKGYRLIRKPAKLYIENTNLLKAITGHLNLKNDIGNAREIFFVNQLKDAGHSISSAATGDFLVNGKTVFEIGGKNKKNTQIKNVKNAFVASDNLEIGFGNKIPLYLFGFMY
ncbi:MAG: AAA family ATPase [Elusimicrobia bacterium]|nr:AAA family ATPase [Elusimicrobiota bacterium]